MEKKRKYIGKKGWERIPFELIKSQSINSNEKILLMLLSMYDPCCFSHAYLSKKLQLSKRQLIRAINHLRELEYLTVYRQPGKKNYYEVFWWEYKNTPRDAVKLPPTSDMRAPGTSDMRAPPPVTPGNQTRDMRAPPHHYNQTSSLQTFNSRRDSKLNFSDLLRVMPKIGRP